MFGRFGKKLPFASFTLSAISLSFQIVVLNPWQKKINDKLEKLAQIAIENKNAIKFK
jgi:hypothetical protein